MDGQRKKAGEPEKKKKKKKFKKMCEINIFVYILQQ